MSKHSLLTRLLSVTLALVVFVATVGVALDVHVCQDEIKSIGVFEKAIACSNMKINSSCAVPSNSKQNNVTQDPCCKSNQFISKINVANSNQAIFEFVNHNFISFDLESRIDRNVFLSSTSVQAIPLLRPPPIEKEFSILFQTFLI